ncbi:MAG: DCC1-like thiol-disulfide oxidoreductase family protein [Methylococcales bacterium]|nr:DCC1-like thiol-disulfide oxidoreductase family protein [Methylococcales bacterium]
MPNQELLLVYDKQCPACNYYCQLIRINETVGELTLIDARDNNPIMEKITAQGLDIDQGMVLVIAGKIYYGSEAIQALALLSSRSGLFNRLNYQIFKYPAIAKKLYPLLRMSRNILLKILHKTKINNLNLDNNQHF